MLSARRLFALAGVVVFLVSTGPRGLQAQALTTASKSADIDVFGGFTYLSTDFGPGRNHGITAGADYTHYFHGPYWPSIEIRGEDTTGPNLSERDVVGGLRVMRQFGRFFPYVDFLYGGGTVVFNVDPSPGYREDRGEVMSIGGGTHIDIAHGLQAKLDWQYQAWNMGRASPALKPPGENFTLAPMVLVVGVNYRIPFKPHVGSGMHRYKGPPPPRDVPVAPVVTPADSGAAGQAPPATPPQ